MTGKIILSCLLLVANASGATAYQSIFEDDSISQARVFFEAAVKSDPQDHQARFYLGRLAMQERVFEQAIDQFDDAIELQENDYQYHYWYATAHIADVWNVGMFKRLTYSKHIREALERAIELKPDHMDSLQRLFGFYALAPPVAGGDIEKAREGLMPVQD